MSTDRTSDQSASAPAARSAHLLRVAGRRRRFGVRVAMAGTLAGLMTSIAVPAMAATGGGQGTGAERVAVTATAAASQHHPTAHPTAPKTPKAGPKTPKAAPKASVEGWQIEAFYDAGYGYADAEVLAGYWGLPSAFDAKLAGGAKVKAGLKLPFPPKAIPKTAPKTVAHR